MELLKSKIDKESIPAHVAVIMDGNGRWAQSVGKNRLEGHHEGANSLSAITEAAAELGVKYLTVYAFSTENWSRPQEEIEALMDLLLYSIENRTEELLTNNIKLEVIGEIEKLPEHIQKRLQESVSKTAHCTHMSLVLALSYSARWELLNATRKIATLVKEGKIKEEEIDEEMFSSFLTTKNMPEPDLLIRTSGELRISNFLLWQLAYTELYFTDTYWPNFRKESFYKAIIDFQTRERRFGKTSEQIQLKND